MSWAPLARILLRYVVGGVVGMEAGDLLAGDPDIVFYAAMGIGAAIEAAYTLAKKWDWTT